MSDPASNGDASGNGHGRGGDIGQRGLRTAAAVVEQMLRLTRQVADGRWPVTLFGTPEAPDGPHPDEEPAGPGRPGPGTGRAADIRALRADAERLIELYGDWTRSLLDGLADLADGTGPSDAGDAVVVGPVAAGATATATAYLHLLDGPLAGPPAVHTTDFTAHHRARIDRRRVTATITDDRGAGGGADRTPDGGPGPLGERLTIAVAVRVPNATPPGPYHGHLLVEDMPEVHLPLLVVVVDPEP